MPELATRLRLLLPTFAYAGMCALANAGCADQAASAQDYAIEQKLVAELTAPDLEHALSAVQSARATSPFMSSLPASALNPNLARLLQWIVRDYKASGHVRLLSAAPEGVNGAGRSNARLRTLQKTYWLQNNGLYGAEALRAYAGPLGRILSDSWRSNWNSHYPTFCPDTESNVVIGTVPSYDGGNGHDDPRCRFPQPGVWEMFRMRQYPAPHDPGFDSLPTPIIGTDYPGEVVGKAAMVTIRRNAPRDLLKYGCLRQVILGNVATAREMFDLALARWDGTGFVEPDRASEQSQGIYWTRDLAFALLCANALGDGDQLMLGRRVKVPKAAIEDRLWSSQAPTGGIWSNYCSASGEGRCLKRSIPPMAKQTNEIAPLVLLVYGKNIWDRSHSPSQQ